VRDNKNCDKAKKKKKFLVHWVSGANATRAFSSSLIVEREKKFDWQKNNFFEISKLL
jgi:hypothetical protein